MRKVQSIEQVEPGMILNGVVTNVTAFGAFVDIGVHQDGLVHISQLANRFIQRPQYRRAGQPTSQSYRIGSRCSRKRYSLSIKSGPQRGEMIIL